MTYRDQLNIVIRLLAEIEPGAPTVQIISTLDQCIKELQYMRASVEAFSIIRSMTRT